MDARRHLFIREVGAFASATPADIVCDLAQTIERVDPGNWAYARVQILQATQSPDVRARLDDLLRSWRTHARDLCPQSVALSLLAAVETDTRHRRGQSVELVWTGPDSGVIPLRRTDQALLQVIGAATADLLIVSFVAYRIPEVAQSLAHACARGVDVKICIEAPEAAEGSVASSAIRAFGADTTGRLSIYRWPPDRRPVTVQGRQGVLHAKCAVADQHMLFISSANLTGHAMTLNMELGLLVQGGPLPGKVAAHFRKLIEQESLQPITGTA